MNFAEMQKKLWHVINRCIGKENDKTNIINYIKVGNIEVYDSKLIADEMGHFFLNNWIQVCQKNPCPTYQN